jgi:tetratricopeptide (TPR) repeat protein
MTSMATGKTQELWTVKFEKEAIARGDCGSLVMDLAARKYIGHIIAGSPISGSALVVPASDVFNDIRDRSSQNLSLATGMKRTGTQDSTEKAESLVQDKVPPEILMTGSGNQGVLQAAAKPVNSDVGDRLFAMGVNVNDGSEDQTVCENDSIEVMYERESHDHEALRARHKETLGTVHDQSKPKEADETYLRAAIDTAGRAVQSTPPNHLDLAGRLNMLASLFRRRFERSGKMKDLEEAIDTARQAVQSTPSDHPDLARYLNNLGYSLGSRFERSGEMKDLEEAIDTARRAVQSTPPGDPDLAASLNNLGGWLRRRFELSGEINDLKEAIDTARQAVQLTPSDHPALAGRLNDLGSWLDSRFERTGEMKDLKEAIDTARQAVQLTPSDHPALAGRLNDLGIWLDSRFERSGEINDLKEALDAARQAVQLTPPDHPNLADSLKNLGNMIGSRFERSGEMKDLEEAVDLHRRAAQSTLSGHGELATYSNTPTDRLKKRPESHVGSLAVIPSSLLLPLGTFRLGRFLTSIDQPLEGYHQPPFATPPTEIVSELDYAEHDQQSSRANFGASMTSLFSAAFSKRAANQVRVEPRCFKAYALDNSEAHFDRAIAFPETKRWIENAAIRRRKIYMVIGFYTMTDTRFVQKSAREQGTQGRATAPVSLSLAAAGAVVPFAGLVDPSVQGEFGSFASNETRIFAPGEQICLIKYREVKYKWLSSRTLEGSRLSKTRQWCYMEGGRRDAYEDEDDDDEDAIEVDIKDAENLGNGWTAAKSEEGFIYART